MALTDISLLFKDIIETPQQKQQRLFAEGQAAAGQFTGLPTGLRELAMGTAAGIPGTVESLRQFGASAGLPVQTQGEQLQGAMGGLNMADPADQAEMVRVLSNIDPLRGATAAAIFEENRKEAALAKEQADLAALQSQNIQSQMDARDALTLREATDQTRTDTERASSRSSLIAFINDADLNEEETERYTSAVNAGQFDTDGLELLMPMINPEADLMTVGDFIYDNANDNWISPPQLDIGMLDLSTNDFAPFSIGNYRRAYFQALQLPEGQARNEAISQAERLVKPNPKDGFKWEEVTRQRGGEEVVEYTQIPNSSVEIAKSRNERIAVNARNRNIHRQSNAALTKIAAIKKAVQTGEIKPGSIFTQISTWLPGSPELVVSADIDTVNSILGLTALGAAREGSASGASGFGQLTEKEMDILQSQIATLKLSLSPEAFLENLGLIEEAFQDSANRSNLVITDNQYIGLEDFPVPPELVQEVF